MQNFVLCERCQVEYDTPADRRFHAEPSACPDCGPAICFQPNESANSTSEPPSASEQANRYFRLPARQSNDVLANIDQVRKSIEAGEIVAIKGIGGFHLACDAKNPAVVRLLRQRKRRPFKPLAVMVADLETASRIAQLNLSDQRLLQSHQRPIVLLRKIPGALPEDVSPCNPYVGVLLPYSPIHHLLMRPGEVWVMTSGNLADEPIAFQNEEALLRLNSLADAFLLHDRLIHTVCDDSVVRSGAFGAIPIRRSRGYAPLPIEISRCMFQPIGDSRSVPLKAATSLGSKFGVGSVKSAPTILAVGGELKSTLCLLVGSQAVMGQHVGDMGHRESLDAMNRSRDHLLSLYRVMPDLIAADLHPSYMSTDWARQLANEWKVPLTQVQHHHAHAAALIAEHGLSADKQMIACVLDGSGYGTDGAIWGGEILLASAKASHRAAYLEYMPLPGGDSAILEPAKTALAFLFGCRLHWNDRLPCVQYYPKQRLTLLRQQLERNINVTKTSSIGRLFDTVASLIGIRHQIDYEGQAALELEALAEEGFLSHGDIRAYPFEWSRDSTSQLRISALLNHICEDQLQGVEPATIAAKFHQTITDCLVTICLRLRDEVFENGKAGQASGRDCRTQCTVGLTGGVFQNAVLLQRVYAALESAGFQVLTHNHVPPNDGGLALGQALVARTQHCHG